jgi:hypothetical protein
MEDFLSLEVCIPELAGSNPDKQKNIGMAKYFYYSTRLIGGGDQVPSITSFLGE